VQLLTMMILVYVIVCTFTAFFAINVGSMYALLPAASSSFSLLFNATLAARFAAPLCFNYLHVIGMDRPTADGHYTVFAQRMGLQPGADVAIPFLGVDFNRWAPVMVLAVAALTLTNAFGVKSPLKAPPPDAFAWCRFCMHMTPVLSILLSCRALANKLAVG
jgi:hypothetical protein